MRRLGQWAWSEARERRSSAHFWERDSMTIPPVYAKTSSLQSCSTDGPLSAAELPLAHLPHPHPKIALRAPIAADSVTLSSRICRVEHAIGGRFASNFCSTLNLLSREAEPDRSCSAGQATMKLKQQPVRACNRINPLADFELLDFHQQAPFGVLAVVMRTTCFQKPTHHWLHSFNTPLPPTC